MSVYKSFCAALGCICLQEPVDKSFCAAPERVCEQNSAAPVLPTVYNGFVGVTVYKSLCCIYISLATRAFVLQLSPVSVNKCLCFT